MPLVQLVVVLIVVGVLLWLVNRFIPMDGKIKSILNVIVVIAVVLWLLNVFGVWGHLRDVRVSIQAPASDNLVAQSGLVVSPAVRFIV